MARTEPFAASVESGVELIAAPALGAPTSTSSASTPPTNGFSRRPVARRAQSVAPGDSNPSNVARPVPRGRKSASRWVIPTLLKGEIPLGERAFGVGAFAETSTKRFVEALEATLYAPTPGFCTPQRCTGYRYRLPDAATSWLRAVRQAPLVHRHVVGVARIA